QFYLLFFSANWSPVGRKFTPQLIDYYNRIKTQHPEFEVIFFSADRSQFGMETYFRDSAMPWPAVAYPKINATAAEMDTKLVKAIPALVFVDRAGDVLSQTGNEADPKSPEKVLADVDGVLTGNKPQVALSQE
ncbi:MAG TPA: thioredoxin-like domain-containing protein, partial [Chthoniobacterales bacterium]|nr:thioredoxin-like domain-containing protein [Chthoniobacterales bacterium]